MAKMKFSNICLLALSFLGLTHSASTVEVKEVQAVLNTRYKDKVDSRHELHFVYKWSATGIPASVRVTSKIKNRGSSPLLITVRQPMGGTISWDLPSYQGEIIYDQIHRTLCLTDEEDLNVIGRFFITLGST